MLHLSRRFHYRGITDALACGKTLKGFGEINVGHSLSLRIYTRQGYISSGLKITTG
jgi:hypothetical protein